MPFIGDRRPAGARCLSAGIAAVALGCWLAAGWAVAAEETPPVPVTTAPLAELQFHPAYSAPATVLALNDSAIGAETAGSVQAIPVRVGDEAEAGTLLVQLDCRDNRIRVRRQQAALDAANAREALAQRQLERVRSLSRERNVSEELLNQRESELRSARAERSAQQAGLESAELNVQRCSVRAPFPGVVMERLVDEGEWAGAGQAVIRLLDNRRLEVSAQIPLDRVAGLRRSEGFAFETDDARLPLGLRLLVDLVDTRGRHREARLQFLADSALPGAAGRLIWHAARPRIPADLPQQRDGRLGLFVAEDERARFHPLPDAIEGHPAPVDLPPETRVIVEGRYGLQDGDALAVTEQDPAL